MKQIQDSSASETRPSPTASGTIGWFQGANLLTGQPGTKVTKDFLNDLQGSFIDLFTRAGVTPTAGPTGDRNLYDSIMSFLGGYVQKAGDTMTGRLTLSDAPTDPLHAATKQYADGTCVKSTNGYQVLPSGLIIQMGQDSTSTGNNDVFYYPQPFPHGVAVVLACESNAQGWMSSAFPTLYGTTRVGLDRFWVKSVAFPLNGSPPQYCGTAFGWIAIGW